MRDDVARTLAEIREEVRALCRAFPLYA